MRRLQDGRLVLRIPKGWDRWIYHDRLYRIDPDGIVRYAAEPGLWKPSHLILT